MRPSEPEFLKQWREWQAMGPPKLCHTCEFFDAEGQCAKFNMAPPAEFANTADACDSWLWAVPF